MKRRAMWSAFALVVGTSSPAVGQFAFDKAKVEAGVEAMGRAVYDGSRLAYGPRVTFNLSRRTAIDVSAEVSRLRGDASTTRVVVVDVRRTLSETPHSAFYVTFGGGGGVRPRQSLQFSHGLPVLPISPTEPVSFLQLGLGVNRNLGTHAVLWGQFQYSMGMTYGGVRVIAGLSVPLGHVAARLDATAPRPSAFSRVPMGQRAWVTMADGVEHQGEVIALTTTEIRLKRDSIIDVLPLSDVRRIEAPDSVKNGARRGALAGLVAAIPMVLAAGGLCEGDAGCAIGFSLLAAGMLSGLGTLSGVLIDSAVEGRRTVYERSSFID